MRRRAVAVIGASKPDAKERALARETGRRLAEAGVAVVTGGLEGVMEEASRGAREAVEKVRAQLSDRGSRP